MLKIAICTEVPKIRRNATDVELLRRVDTVKAGIGSMAADGVEKRD